MDNITLASNESIIHKTQTIIINGVRCDAVLTSRRLILVESETGRIHEDIPFAEIDLAISRVNKLREPFITLIIHTPDGGKRTIELIFIQLISNRNIVELEKCIVILKEHDVPIEGISQVAIRALLSKREKNTDESLVEEQVSRPAIPEWTIVGPLRNNRKSEEEEESPSRTPLMTIGIILLILVVLIGGISIVGQSLHEKPPAVPQNTTPSVVKTEVTISSTPIPTPATTPTIQVTSIPADSLPPDSIPPTGVWVKVKYPGNFSGSIGARGRNIELSGSGTQWHQLPVTDTTIDGTIAKLDGSSDKMDVDIYKDGTLISRKITRVPYGVIELHATGPKQIMDDVVATPVPTPVIQSIEDYLPKLSIPTTGVWVRVYYPGYFYGTLGGQGLYTTMKSTGDQLYEIPANVGIVEGSIEKDDGSVGRLVTEVYKNATLISRMETRKPEGLIDIHVPV